MSNEAVKNYIETHFNRFIDEVSECLRIPSISTDPTYKTDITHCAQHLKTECERIGLENIQVIPTDGHPIIYADWRHQPDKPTLLIYGHYDVQPADPLDLWTSPPFEPTIRDNALFARGMADNKGQVYCFLKSIEAYLKTNGKLPLNIKMIIEGEEESGSPNLENFIQHYQNKLHATAAIISDTPMFGPNTPSITFSLKGLAFAEIIVRGAATDLHSGQHGGPVPNPAQALAYILSKCKDEKSNTVSIPGFYDAVKPIPAEIHRATEGLPFDETAYLNEHHLSEFWKEDQFHPLEQQWYRPTFEINGMVSGYTGKGAKTIIPSSATAKVSLRLVPDQDPDTATKQLVDHINKIKPNGVEVEINTMHGYHPAQSDIHSPQMNAAVRAMTTTYGTPPAIHGDGGSVPAIALIKQYLGIDTVMLGFYLRSDNIHAPNERMSLDHFKQGIIACTEFYNDYANEL